MSHRGLRSIRLLALSVGLASPLAAQGTLRGSVFDSLATKAPLAGAHVVLQGAPHAAITDRQGRFTLRDVPAGRHVVSFFHATLDSLEVTAPSLVVEILHGRTATANLGIPSARGISEQLCGVEPETSTAVVFGLARSAEDGTLLAGAVASVKWYEVVISGSGARQVERTAADTTAGDGRYVLCGVPNDIATSVRVSSGAQATGAMHLALDGTGFGRLDAAVSLSDTASRVTVEELVDDTTLVARPRGSSSIRVRVTDELGRAVKGAIVGVRGTSASGVTREDGTLLIQGAPAGSQTIIGRALGLAQSLRVVVLAPGKETPLSITLEKAPRTLPTVAVVGDRRSSLESQFDLRRKQGLGKFFEGRALDGARNASAFWGRISGVYIYTGGGAEFDPIPLMQGAMGVTSRCMPNIWVDGALQYSLSGWEIHTMMMGARRLEVYTRQVQTPAQFQSPGNACGSIVIWSY